MTLTDEITLNKNGTRWAFILAAVSSILLSTTDAQVCMGCTYDGSNANCNFLDLTVIPTCLPASTTDLHFVFNDLSILPGDAFIGLPNLEKLNLDYCKINNLPEEIFSYLPNLKYLQLEGNSISYLPDNLFVNNTNLYSIVLSLNSLTTINPVVFNPLVNLGSLYLPSNNLNSIVDNRTFLFNTGLRNLDLSYNDLTTLDKSLFSTNSYIEIRLPGNLWHCDCVITDLLAYFRSVNITFSPDFYPKCTTPAELNDMYWTEIDPQPCSS